MSKSVLSAAALLVALVSLASAQRGGGGGMPGGMPGGFGGMQMMSKSDAIIKELKIDALKKPDVEKIFDEIQKQTTPLLAQIDDIRKEVAGLNAANASDVEAVKKLTVLEAQMAAGETEALVKVLAMADEKQRNKAPKVFDMIVGMFRGPNWRMAR